MKKSEKIYVNGYRFVTASQSKTTIYLKCANFRAKCKARASQRKSTMAIYITREEHTPTCQREILKCEWEKCISFGSRPSFEGFDVSTNYELYPLELALVDVADDNHLMK